MKGSTQVLVALVAGGAIAQAAAAQLQYATDFNHRFAWEENLGWTNWADYGPSGMKIFATFIGGWIWSENAGWICLGDGTPSNGQKYANVNGSDYGVNLAADGKLSGYAWGENIGWVNFSGGAMASPPNAARFDQNAKRLRGYAWGENVGWINLDDATHYVGVIPVGCYADCDNSGALDLFDFLCFQNAFVGQKEYADCDKNATFDLFDFLCYVNAFNQGC